RDRSHDLDPASVHARLNPIDFVKRVIAILLIPKISTDRVECEPKRVTQSISEDLLDVCARLTADRSASAEERIVRRRRAIMVYPLDDCGERMVVGVRPAELIIRLRGRWPLRQVLQLSPAAVIADHRVQFTVRSKSQNPCVVIAGGRLGGVPLIWRKRS